MSNVDVLPQEQEEQDGTSKVVTLLNRLMAEAERQQKAVDSVTKGVDSVLSTVPHDDGTVKAPMLATVGDSMLVTRLDEILHSFENNTNRLFGLADRIEL